MHSSQAMVRLCLKKQIETNEQIKQRIISCISLNFVAVESDVISLEGGEQSWRTMHTSYPVGVSEEVCVCRKGSKQKKERSESPWVASLRNFSTEVF